MRRVKGDGRSILASEEKGKLEFQTLYTHKCLCVEVREERGSAK